MPYIFRRSHRRCFTLIELLVVISIIGVLVSLLIPAVQSAREAARRSSCQNNSRQMGIAVLNFESVRRVFPPSGFTRRVVGNATGKQIGWRPLILPFVEEQNLSDLYDTKLNWWEGTNADAATTMVGLFECPSTTERVPSRTAIAHRGRPALEFDEPIAPSDYEAIMGVQPEALNPHLKMEKYHQRNRYSVMYRDSRVKMRDVRDGTSRTIIIVECAGRPQVFRDGRWQKEVKNDQGIGWADSGGAFSLDGSNSDGSLEGAGPDSGCVFAMNRRNDNEPYSFHTTGCNMVFADGHVEFLSEDIELVTLAALVTKNGAERARRK